MSTHIVKLTSIPIMLMCKVLFSLLNYLLTGIVDLKCLLSKLSEQALEMICFNFNDIQL